MNRFIRELRRREVFRTVGLYVGICWILIEVATVVLPTFDTPEWVIRAAIMVALAGFPVMLVFAWVFDVSKEGIRVQADPTETIVEQLGARRTDFVVIGILALALGVSLYLNVSGDVAPVAKPDPVAVMIASFDNDTDEQLFYGVLEEALIVGLEAAPHISVRDRDTVFQIGREINPDARSLDVDLAREVAEREGIDLLLTGSLERSGNNYRIAVDAIDLANGREVFTLDEKANSRDEVLQAIGDLSAGLRKRLGDSTLGDHQGLHAETFVATSLDAAHAYFSARQFQKNDELEEAAEHYRQAISLDPQLGRAYSALALVEFTLGLTDKAEERWSKALSLADTMTERERLRALGRYYRSVTADSNRAMEVYSEFVDKYPADVGALDEFAAAAFQQLNFSAAVGAIREILEIFPADKRYRAKLALYSMYSGDWQAAADEAGTAIASDPENGAVYLPLAIAAMVRGEFESSRDAYRRMALTSATAHDASVAELGLADIELYLGQVDAARKRLRAGISADLDGSKQYAAALKFIALAESYAGQEDYPAATAAAQSALQLADGIAVEVPAATIYIRAGDLEAAQAIASDLTTQQDAFSLAYAQMLGGIALESDGAQTQAVLALREAIGSADLWLIRYQLGKAYLRAGHNLEAMDELTTLKERSGEAASIFLDDMPTFRSVADLPYWIGRAQEELNMDSAARESYEEYLEFRLQEGAIIRDAKMRLAGLN